MLSRRSKPTKSQSLNMQTHHLHETALLPHSPAAKKKPINQKKSNFAMSISKIFHYRADSEINIL